MKWCQTPDGVSQIIASRWQIGAALAIAMLLCFSFIILLPLVDGIILGLVFAYIARPIQIKFEKHRKLGALVASLCIFVPIVFIVGVGIVEILNQISWIIDNKTAVIGAILDFIRALNIPPELYGSVNDSIRIGVLKEPFYLLASCSRQHRYYWICQEYQSLCH